MESFCTCNMLVLWLESEVVGQPREKPVFMPTSAFSWELSRDDNSPLSYLENEMTNPTQITIKTHRKNQWNFFVIPLQKVEKWIPPNPKENIPTFSKLQHLEQILIAFELKTARHCSHRGEDARFAKGIGRWCLKRLCGNDSKWG